MSELDSLSAEQLQKLIEVKKQSRSEPDYSHQDQRGVVDALRDTGYGAIHGAWDFGKMMGNAVTGGNFEKIPGYKQYIPFMEKQIEKIKSPNPSPVGDALKIAGEFLPIEGKAAQVGVAGIRKSLSKLPSLTNKGRTKAYEEAIKIANEEGAKGLQHNPQLIQDVGDFYARHELPAGQHLSGLGKGSVESALNVKNTLGKLSRKYGVEPFAQTSAENLHGELGQSIMHALKQGGFHRSAGALSHAEQNYKRSMQLKNLLLESLKNVSGVNLVRSVLKHH